MTSPSIRGSLLIRCGIGIGTLLFILSAGTYLLVRHRLYHELDYSIELTASLLANQIEYESGHITFEWQEGLGTNQEISGNGLFQFWEEKTGASTRSPALQERDLPRFTGMNGGPLLRTIHLPDGKRARAVGLRVYPFIIEEERKRMQERNDKSDPKNMPFILVVAREVESIHKTLELLRSILGIGTILILGLGFVLIHRVIRASLEPIDLLSEQMRSRSEFQLDSALDLPEEFPKELTGLAHSFDLLLARVARIRHREKDFIRHAAHELRNPIAGLRATTDFALSQPRDAQKYRASLTSCQKTAIELGELVKRFSALARLESSMEIVKIESVDFRNVFSSLVEALLPRFEERGLQVEVDIPADSSYSIQTDRMLLQVICNNLLDNAISYSESGTVKISLKNQKDSIELRVSNPVKDIADDLDMLFEPLFRGNESRHDSSSHLGIGLPLSQKSAQLMNGSLRARKTSDNEIEFILNLRNANEVR